LEIAGTESRTDLCGREITMDQHLSNKELKFWTDDRNRGNAEVKCLGNHLLNCRKCRDRSYLYCIEKFRSLLPEDKASDKLEGARNLNQNAASE
jgi:hypothetical protein